MDKKKTKKKIGRPTIYSKKLAALICEQIVLGRSLREITKLEGMPAISAIFVWFGKHEEFKEQYTRAKEEQAETLADEIVEIADDASNDWMERNDPDNPGYVLNKEHVQRSKLRVEARKWVASKLKPKKYGDKQEVDHTSGGDKVQSFTLGLLSQPQVKDTTSEDE